MIDKYAPIIPYVGMGGIRLNSTREEVEEILGEKLKNPTMQFEGRRSRYDLGDLMLLFFEEETEQLIMMTTQRGYKGKLFGRFDVNSTVEELMDYDSSFVFDEFDETCLSEERGICVAAASLQGRTDWISVFVEDIEKRCK